MEVHAKQVSKASDGVCLRYKERLATVLEAELGGMIRDV